MEFTSFYIQHTHREVNHEDGPNTPTYVDPSSVSGETELNAYMRVQQLSDGTDVKR